MNERGTPLGGTRARRVGIGLSKACQIFGVARVTLRSFLVASHRELAMGLDHIRSEIADAPTGRATAQGNTATAENGHTDTLG
jgi:hypothetical protein